MITHERFSFCFHFVAVLITAFCTVIGTNVGWRMIVLCLLQTFVTTKCSTTKKFFSHVNYLKAQQIGQKFYCKLFFLTFDLKCMTVTMVMFQSEFRLRFWEISLKESAKGGFAFGEILYSLSYSWTVNWIHSRTFVWQHEIHATITQDPSVADNVYQIQQKLLQKICIISQ